MLPDTKDILRRMGQQEKQFNSLYRSLASAFKMPECSMWILYYLAMEETPLTQHELIDRMMFSKQTIHSAVSWLVKKGWVHLETIPSARNSKHIQLTDAGRQAAEASVCRVLVAEANAVNAMSTEKIIEYIELHEALSDSLVNAFRDEGLFDDQTFPEDTGNA